MSSTFTILGLGEALFDIFPDRSVLGGAPLNCALCAHQLGQVHGGRTAVVSRLGQDELAQRAIGELAQHGMDTRYLQSDPDYPTGKVYVTVDEQGEPGYEIVEGAAWDWMQWDTDLDELALHCEALCFSGLCQRNNQSRSTVQRFVAQAKQAIRMFDLTLRQHYYDQRMLKRSCELATVVKLNIEELDILAGEVSLGGQSVNERAADLIKRYDLTHVVVTQGKAGTIIFTPSNCYAGDPGNPVHYPPQENADSVGAGDACSAAILVGLVLRLPVATIVELANHAGAYVASVAGATPTLPDEILDRFG